MSRSLLDQIRPKFGQTYISALVSDRFEPKLSQTYVFRPAASYCLLLARAYCTAIFLRYLGMVEILIPIYRPKSRGGRYFGGDILLIWTNIVRYTCTVWSVRYIEQAYCQLKRSCARSVPTLSYCFLAGDRYKSEYGTNQRTLFVCLSCLQGCIHIFLCFGPTN